MKREPQLSYPDLYLGDSALLWFRLVPEWSGEDLYARRVFQIQHGTPPGWLADIDDWESVFDFPSKTRESGLGWCFRHSGTDWALEHGLAPGQPFLIRMDSPEWYRTSWEYAEYDVTYYWELVSTAPWTAATIARSWERWLAAQSAYQEAACTAMRDLLHRQRTDRSALYLQTRAYLVNAVDYAPRGLILGLYTRHRELPGLSKGSCGELAKVWEPSGNFEAAVERLTPLLPEAFPGLTVEELLQLPKRR